MASEAEDEMKVDSHAALSKHKHGNKQTSAGRFRGERISRRAKPHKSYREDNSDEEFRIDEKNCVKAKAGKRKDTSSRMMLEKKQRQISETLRWLGENYELKDGKCLPRCVMYTHYLDFCKKNKLCPSGPATFGKIIRQRFPKLTTRRLGTRGQSKYHYYGIGVKETSPYFHAGYSKKGLTRFSGIKGKGEGSNKKFSLSSKSGTLLPEFPEARKLELPDGVSAQKLETFIMMYRTHCQRMLDTVVSANFDGVQNFILHFWRGMPGHIMSVLESPMVVDLVGVCDSILYKVLTDVLIPSTIQDLPDSLREEINSFAANLLEWLEESLAKVPVALKEAKLEVARMFTQGLRRQVCFIHLAQTARSVLLSYEAVSKMLTDLRKIDFANIFSKCCFLSEQNDIFDKAGMFVQELDELLSKQAPLEAYTEWLDSLVDRCVLQSSAGTKGRTLQDRAKDFLRMWSFVTGGVLADLTLRSAPSFGVFHLIHMTFEEYAFLIIESQLLQDMDRNMTLSLQRFVKKEYRTVEPRPVLPPPPQCEGVADKHHEVPRKRKKPDPINLSEISNNPLKELGNRMTTCVPHPSILHERFNTTSPVYSKPSTPVVYAGTDRAHHHSRLSAPSTPTVSANNMPRTMSPTVSANNMPRTMSPTVSANNMSRSMSSGHVSSVPQYSFPDDDIHYQASVSEGSSFHNELMNAIDKTLFSNAVALNANQYSGAPWLVENSANPVHVGSMHYADMSRNSVGFQEVQRNAENFQETPRHSENFQGIHDNPKNFAEMIRAPENFQGISPTDHHSAGYSNNNNNGASFAFSYTPQGNYAQAIGSYAAAPSVSSINTIPSRNDFTFPTNGSHAFPKFNNNFYFEQSRTAVQPTGDVMAFSSFAHATGNELGIDGIVTHEAQLGRVGVGAV